MKIDEFFTAIKDGGWHHVEELSEKLEIPISKLAEFSQFLSDHNLLKYDEKAHRIRIEPIWKLLLPEEELTEQKTTVATFVIPPETSISVQSTHITNLSNIELEVSLRIRKEIEEVAIKT